MELQNIQDLLNRASAINRQYEKIADITGENFNVFKILKLSTHEVRTHTAFIAELLNPNGSHGQKEAFLQLFCDQMKIEEFECVHATLQKEKHIGFIPNDYSEGGYIDILIADKKRNGIVIENKIHALDRDKQLFRYYKYAQNKFAKYTLFYLTLDGKEASKVSKYDTPERCIKNISYTEDILVWLEKCKEKAVSHPILRETISQYIYLIKHLTHQTLSNDMSNDLISLIASNKEYYNSIEDLTAARDNFNRNVIVKFWKALHEKVRSNFPVVIFENLEIKYDIIEGNESCDFPIVIGRNIIIKCFIAEDEEAFYYGFSVKNLPDTSPDLEIHADSLRDINHNFTKNPNYNIGWISLDGTKDKHLFMGQIDKDLIFKLNDEIFLNNYVDNIIKELSEYAEQFKFRLETIKVKLALPD